MIIGNVRRFDDPHFKCWAGEFALVNEPWLEHIIEVIQDVRGPETAASTGGRGGLEGTYGVYSR